MKGRPIGALCLIALGATACSQHRQNANTSEAKVANGLALESPAAAATPPREMATGNFTLPWFNALNTAYEALIMYAKFNRQLVTNDKLVQTLAVVTPGTGGSCARANVFNNEFDSANATKSARASLSSFLDRLPAKIDGMLIMHLGVYDRAAGGFPLGDEASGGRVSTKAADILALTPYYNPPANVGMNVGVCGLNPYPRRRVQIRFVSPSTRDWGYLKMDEAAARAYVAAHPNLRQVYVHFTTNIASTRELPNGWRDDPAYVYELVGTYGNIRVRDFTTDKWLPAAVTFK